VLRDPEFTQQVKKRVSIVEFYADWCGHCKEFSKVYKEVSKVLKGVIPVIAVNDESLAQKYSVKGYPTVKV
ncbi:protein disulfide isomerase, putative, partial [Ixodes scapularis]